MCVQYLLLLAFACAFASNQGRPNKTEMLRSINILALFQIELVTPYYNTKTIDDNSFTQHFIKKLEPKSS